jgi:hypothetical protein
MTKARSLSDFIESDGSVTLVDNQKIKVGTGNDLEIYHNGTNSIIADVGTGNIEILGNNLRLKNADASNSYLNGDNGGGVTLYHAGTQKFITTSTGVSVTGKVVTTAMEMGGGTSSASIYRTGSDGSGFHFSTNAILPADQTGAVANGTEDLGGSGNKFKDLHLSGSANVGTVVSSGSISGTSANFTNDVAINNGSPELYFGTTGAHYNWRIATQENVDAALTIDVGSQDTDYSNDTYNSQVIVKNTGSVGLGAAPSAADWGSASRVLQITGTQPLVSLKDTDTGEIQLATSGQTFYIWDSVGSASRMQIRADGSIAIGANNAGYDGQILSVKAGSNDNVFYGESTDANCIVSLRDNSSTANIGYGALGNAHVFSQDGTEIARFSTGSADKYPTSGNGGIGGSGSNLHLHGDDSEIRMANQIIHADNSGLTKFTIRNAYGYHNNGAELSLDGGYISFNTSTSFTESMRVYADSVVDVGRTGTSGQGSGTINIKSQGASYLNFYDVGNNTIRLFSHSVNLRMKDVPNNDDSIQFEAAGNIDIDGSYLSGGFDYAEFFESTDGTAIPVGTSVVLVNEKVRAATSGEQPLGVVRPGKDGTSVVGGAAHLKWNGKYLKDDYDAYLYDTVDYWTWKDVGDTNNTGDEDQQCWSDRVPSGWVVPSDKVVTSRQRKRLNPDFVENLDSNGEQIYVNRESRDEWNCIGLLGQVPITKGQVTNSNWTKLKDRSATVELWFIK